MRVPTALLSVIVSLLFCSLSETGLAQIVFGEPKSITGRAVYQSWTLEYDQDETKVSQVAFPLAFYLPIAENWELFFNTALSSSSFNDIGHTSDFTTITSPTVRVFHSFLDDRLFAAAGFVAPSGKRELDTVEVRLAQLLSDEYLNFPVKQVGSGVGIILQTGAAAESGSLLYGATVSYAYAGKYKYIADGDDYDPGDEIVVQGSGSFIDGDRGVDLDLAFKYYLADKVEGEALFRNGTVFTLMLGGHYKIEATSFGVSITQILRGKNSPQVVDGSLRSEDKNSNHNKTVVAGSVGHLLGSSLNVGVLAQYRQMTANKYNAESELYFGKSTLFSVGPNLEYTGPDQRFSLFAGMLLHSGDANQGAPKEKEFSISGYEVSVGGRVKF